MSGVVFLLMKFESAFNFGHSTICKQVSDGIINISSSKSTSFHSSQLLKQLKLRVVNLGIISSISKNSAPTFTTLRKLNKYRHSRQGNFPKGGKCSKFHQFLSHKLVNSTNLEFSDIFEGFPNFAAYLKLQLSLHLAFSSYLFLYP